MLAAMATGDSKRSINAALALFNRRWVLRILWELRGGSLTFRQLQDAAGGISASVLNRRLQELREAVLVSHDPGAGYELTPMGLELLTAFDPLLRWSVRWQKAAGAASRKASAAK
jgi:DNA-binding HxlR family transcriptional regulator